MNEPVRGSQPGPGTGPVRGLLLAAALMVVSSGGAVAQLPAAGGGLPAGAGAGAGGPAGPAGAGPAGVGAAGGAAPAGMAGGTGIQATRSIVLDPRNRSLTILATPSQHREIEELLDRLTRDPRRGQDIRVKEFTLVNITPAELKRVVRFFKPGLNLDDQRNFLSFQEPENRGDTTVIPRAPASVTVGGGGSGGAGAGGGADAGGGGAGAGGAAPAGGGP